jgi:hypothetical protein
MRGVWLGPPLSEGLSLGEDQERLAAQHRQARFARRGALLVRTHRAHLLATGERLATRGIRNRDRTTAGPQSRSSAAWRDRDTAGPP